MSVHLRKGANVLAIAVANTETGPLDPGAFCIDLRIGSTVLAKTDTSWPVSRVFVPGWSDVSGVLSNVETTYFRGSWDFYPYGPPGFLNATNWPSDSSAQWIWPVDIWGAPVTIYSRIQFNYTP